MTFTVCTRGHEIHFGVNKTLRMHENYIEGVQEFCQNISFFIIKTISFRLLLSKVNSKTKQKQLYQYREPRSYNFFRQFILYNVITK